MTVCCASSRARCAGAAPSGRRPSIQRCVRAEHHGPEGHALVYATAHKIQPDNILVNHNGGCYASTPSRARRCVGLGRPCSHVVVETAPPRQPRSGQPTAWPGGSARFPAGGASHEAVRGGPAHTLRSCAIQRSRTVRVDLFRHGQAHRCNALASVSTTGLEIVRQHERKMHALPRPRSARERARSRVTRRRQACRGACLDDEAPRRRGGPRARAARDAGARASPTVKPVRGYPPARQRVACVSVAAGGRCEGSLGLDG
jgi:hypothetical protein